MQFLILGLVLLVLILVFGRAYTRADPKSLAKNLRSVTGMGLLAAAVFLIATGKWILGVPIAMFALSFLGFSLPWQDGFGNADKSEGQRSTVRTEMLEMTLDHDSGQMEGMVRKGQYAGRRLSTLSHDQLNTVLAEAHQHDAQAAQLLEAYIARFHQGGGNAGSGRSGRKRAADGGPMTVDEAYAILGLERGANRDDVLSAHRALMKKYHPDQGGTTYLATKINEAKDVLLEDVAQ